MVNYERVDLTFLNFKRFLARIIDISIYVLLCRVVYFVLLNQFPFKTELGSFILSYISVIVMLILEPVWLHYLATTPGKFLCGLYVYNINDNKLSFEEAFDRTKRIFVYGMGLNIPTINTICCVISYIKAKNNQFLAWETRSRIVERKRWLWSHGLCLLGVFLCLFLSAFVEVRAAMAIHIGEDITKSEIVENYERYLKYYNVDAAPPLKIEEDDGKVIEVSFKIEVVNKEGASYNEYSKIASAAVMAYAGAQNGSIGYYNWGGYSIYGDDFTFYYRDYSNILIEADIEKSGYDEEIPDVLIAVEGEEQYYSLHFKMTNMVPNTGSYYISSENAKEYGGIVPVLTLSDNGSFTFSTEPESENYHAGCYNVDCGNIIATEDDNTYIFQLIDRETIKFLPDESSKIRIFYDAHVERLDEVIFKLDK